MHQDAALFNAFGFADRSFDPDIRVDRTHDRGHDEESADGELGSRLDPCGPLGRGWNREVRSHVPRANVFGEGQVDQRLVGP